MKKKLIFKGVATALITPFSEGKIDYTALDRLIEFQIDGGASALVIGGTTGEVATLDSVERYRLYAHARERIGGRVRLILGTGTNDTRLAINHTEEAERVGCDGVLVVTPYYNKGTYRGVTEHYKAIAKNTSLPIILYNVPSRTGVNLTQAQLCELSELDNIVAIKEATDSADRLTELSCITDRLTLYAGNDTQILETLALGGMGVISVISNLYPKCTYKLCEAVFSGDYPLAQKIQMAMFPLTKLLFKETNPAPIKYLLYKSGLSKNELRLPLFPVENDTRVALELEKSRFENWLSENGI